MKPSKKAERRWRSLIKYVKRLQNVYNSHYQPEPWWKIKTKMFHWLMLLKDTPKTCNKNCCRGPRRNEWNKAKAKLTRAELMMLDNFEQQMRELDEDIDT